MTKRILFLNKCNCDLGFIYRVLGAEDLKVNVIVGGAFTPEWGIRKLGGVTVRG
jgi:hypothetical protein